MASKEATKKGRQGARASRPRIRSGLPWDRSSDTRGGTWCRLSSPRFPRGRDRPCFSRTSYSSSRSTPRLFSSNHQRLRLFRSSLGSPVSSFRVGPRGYFVRKMNNTLGIIDQSRRVMGPSNLSIQRYRAPGSLWR